MNRDAFADRLRAIYQENPEYLVAAFPSVDDFILCWSGEVVEQSDGTWDKDKAEEVLGTLMYKLVRTRFQAKRYLGSR